LTTSPRPDFPSIAHFAPGEIRDSECWAVADDTWPIYKDDIVKGMGAVPARLMTRIDEALHAALDLQH
jgi:hypothetical protein